MALLGCLAAFATLDHDWWVESGEGGAELITGRAVTNGLAATIPTAAIAGLFLTLVFSPVGKRMIGVVVSLLGLAALAAALLALPPDGVAKLGRAANGSLTHTPAWTFNVVGTAAIALGGLVLAVWPGVAGARVARAGGAATESDWVLLDRGQDPTEG